MGRRQWWLGVSRRVCCWLQFLLFGRRKRLERRRQHDPSVYSFASTRCDVEAVLWRHFLFRYRTRGRHQLGWRSSRLWWKWCSSLYSSDDTSMRQCGLRLYGLVLRLAPLLALLFHPLPLRPRYRQINQRTQTLQQRHQRQGRLLHLLLLRELHPLLHPNPAHSRQQQQQRRLKHLYPLPLILLPHQLQQQRQAANLFLRRQ